ncbi:MAG TPA: hypothetical protein VFH27_01715 [Longimicrobiaceae bacterium]|nr:hypothetical protein [Longimicrobiaceae bacterium]
MDRPTRGPELPPDPVRDHLKAVRLGLFRLHKALIDSERAVFEGLHGPQSNGQFLQALIGDDFFAWLRPFTGVIVRMDEALATREPIPEAETRGFLDEAGRLVMSADDEAAAERFAEARLRDSTVQFLHSELARRIAEGPAAADGG